MEKLHSAAELTEYINKVGMLPLLRSCHPWGGRLRKWWPDFCNYRRSTHPYPTEGSFEEAIVETLKLNGSMITRDLRKACHPNRTPEESRQRLMKHFKEIIPEGTEELFNRFLDKKS